MELSVRNRAWNKMPMKQQKVEKPHNALLLFILAREGGEFRKAMYLIPLLAEWIGRGVDGTGPVKGSIQ